jgi:N-acetylmuramoyl-L-alanine amidase
MKYFLCALIFLVQLLSCGPDNSPRAQSQTSLTNRVICIDPGHGGSAHKDNFRKGPTGEREEWINLRVALLLRDLLQAQGATVWLTRTTDTDTAFPDRTQLARTHKADLFISIHHNASGDTKVNFPIVFFGGNASNNPQSVRLGKLILQQFNKQLFADSAHAVLVSDYTVYQKSGTFVLRDTPQIPSIIGEAAFYSNALGEKLLKDSNFNKREAQAYLDGIRQFFEDTIAVQPIVATGKIPVFESYRGIVPKSGDVSNWQSLFLEAQQLIAQRSDLQRAAQLLARSAIARFVSCPRSTLAFV